MSTFQFSSGDPAADRRYDHARRAAADGDHAAAVDFLREATELTPAWPPVWFALAQAHEALGDGTSAIAAHRRVIALDPDGLFGAALHLARLGEAAAPPAAPAAYVRGLFDQYADRFDRHLVDELQYTGPDIIAGAVLRACSTLSRPVRFKKALDLGCGTGLVASRIHEMCDILEGVDLSPRMVDRARAGGRYSRIETGDILPFLDGCEPASADLVTAADVFIYIGDLAPLLRSVRRVLARGALFAFTVQVAKDGDYTVGQDLRYLHSRAYLERLGEAEGLAAVASDDATLRRDRGVAVPALALVMTAP